MNKQVLREIFSEKRKFLSREEYDRRNQSVCQKTIAFLKTTDKKAIHLFLPIVKNKEVDTWPILKFLINSKTHTPIVSRTDFASKSMVHYQINENTEFINDKFDIPTPVRAKQLDVEMIDAVLAPLISFDLEGNRIGYGGGYYDRLLSECRKDTLVAGLAITPPLDLITYAEPHDHKLNMCFNHQQTFKF